MLFAAAKGIIKKQLFLHSSESVLFFLIIIIMMAPNISRRPPTSMASHVSLWPWINLVYASYDSLIPSWSFSWASLASIRHERHFSNQINFRILIHDHHFQRFVMQYWIWHSTDLLLINCISLVKVWLHEQQNILRKTLTYSKGLTSNRKQDDWRWNLDGASSPHAKAGFSANYISCHPFPFVHLNINHIYSFNMVSQQWIYVSLSNRISVALIICIFPIGAFS